VHGLAFLQDLGPLVDHGVDQPLHHFLRGERAGLAPTALGEFPDDGLGHRRRRALTVGAVVVVAGQEAGKGQSFPFPKSGSYATTRVDGSCCMGLPPKSVGLEGPRAPHLRARRYAHRRKQPERPVLKIRPPEHTTTSARLPIIYLII
jgi:hypothetical protein